MNRPIFIILVLSLLSITTSNTFGLDRPKWAQNYNGIPQFRLEDDRQFMTAKGKANALKQRLSREQEKLDKNHTVLKQKQNGKVKLQKEIKNIQNQIVQFEQADKKNKAKIKDLRTQNKQLKEKIKGWDKQIQGFQQQMAGLKQQKDKTAEELSDEQKANELAKTLYQEKLSHCLNELKKSVEECHKDGAIAYLKKQVSEHREEINNFKKEVANKEKEITEIKKQTNHSNNQKKELNIVINHNKKKIDHLQGQIPASPDKRAALRKKIREINVKIEAVDDQMIGPKAIIADLSRRIKDLGQNLKQAQKEKKIIKTRLINHIIESNQRGYERGMYDGQQEGMELANQHGNQQGHQDGRTDGLSQGEQEGRDRDYKNGRQQGFELGKEEGGDQGKHDGQISGARAGNIRAGEIQGDLDGQHLAQESDASAVGKSQGENDGMKRAQKDGQHQGHKVGQKEAISHHEKKQLKKQNILGPYAGTFHHRTPRYPGSNRRNYRMNDRGITGHMLKMAFKDGYNAAYYHYSERTYNREIERVYELAYNNYKNEGYREAHSQSYQDSFEKGKSVGHKEGYDRVYQNIKDQYHNHYYQQLADNPDTQSNDYKNSRSRAKDQSYKSNYKKIRSASYQLNELSTYNDNLAQQTEIYRQSKYREVSEIYQNHAVLKFVSSSISDGGVNGVAASDQIFQPGENVVHHVTIMNFGQQNANNVKVASNQSSRTKSISIPAQSVTTVKGAMLSTLSESIEENSIEKNILKIHYRLQSQLPQIEGRFFYNSKSGQLIRGDQKRITIKYPLTLTNLKVHGQMFYGQENSLEVTVKNNSRKSYQGPLEVRLSPSIGEENLVSNFESLSYLSSRGSARAQGGRIEIQREEDTFKDIHFNAAVYKDGVLLGKLDRPITAMAKVTFIDKENSLVLLGDSSYDSNFMKEIKGQMGDDRNVSVLDISIRENKQFINSRFQNRNLLVALGNSQSRSKILSKINSMLYNSNHCFFALITNSDKIDIENRVKQFEALNSHSYVPTNFKQSRPRAINFYITNPLVNKDLHGSNNIAVFNQQEVAAAKSIGDCLALSADDLIDQVGTTVNKDNYYHLDYHQANLLQSLSFRVIEDMLKINLAYDTFRYGWFKRRDKSWPNKLRNDHELHISKIFSALDNGHDYQRQQAMHLYAINLSSTIGLSFRIGMGVIYDYVKAIDSVVNKHIENVMENHKDRLDNLLYHFFDNNQFYQEAKDKNNSKLYIPYHL